MKKYITIFMLLCSGVVKAQFNYPPAPPALVNITEAEYFIDTDPGFGLGTAIPITTATNISALIASINLTGLTPGVHQLMIRSRDANGYWSITATQTFENLQPAYNNAAATVNVNAVEYFIDTDPGFGLGTGLSFTPAQNINSLLVNVDLTGAGTPGNKLFFIRSIDANGKWSLTNSTLFNNAIYIYPPVPAAQGNVMMMEYFFNDDPGFGNGTPVTFTATADLSNFLFSADISNLALGTHTLFIRSKQNPWSLVAASEFNKSTALPVTFLSFTGALSNNNAVLKWVTSSEQNSSHFIVERSTNGTSYTAIGNVPAAGNSNVQQQYNFTDAGITTGITYYRLKQMDIDGNYKYSPIINLLNRNGQAKTIIAPNPVENILTIVEAEMIFIRSLQIFDSKGTLVFSKQIGNRQQIISLPVNNLSSGQYVLRINYADYSRSLQMIKK